ncbi:hypothetical protein EC988_003200 [Linderina pennispora]|nr:hypothetical protein EC988_003200 [Linderina pennispora]
MRQPPADIALSSGGFEHETHWLLSDTIAVTPDANHWTVSAQGAAWHVWGFTTLLDSLDLPQWPSEMATARIVLSTEMCREKPSVPRMPFMLQRGIEHCGMHASATAVRGVYDEQLEAAKAEMRQWMAALMEWPEEKAELGPDAFIDVHSSSIYYFAPFDSKALAAFAGKQKRLNLARYALDPESYLRTLVNPHVNRLGRTWLDQHRIDITLHRTSHGFVQIDVQVLSMLPPSEDPAVVSKHENSTAKIAWMQGPSVHVLEHGQKKAKVVDMPRQLSAVDDISDGYVVEKIKEFRSFHPALKIESHVESMPTNCNLTLVQTLPRTYFFDPYQIYDTRLDARMFGPVELEKPAEAMPNWGSILTVSRVSANTQVEVPIHARYRLAPFNGRTVGYNGEPDGESHTDVTLLPAISLVVCQRDVEAEPPVKDELFGRLVFRPALLPELLARAGSVLEIAPESDLVLRMPIAHADKVSMIQALTLAALFAGTFVIFRTIQAKMSASEQPHQKSQ